MSDKLAEHAHDVWAKWMKYQFSREEMLYTLCSPYNTIQVPHMSKEDRDRWNRQSYTPYSELSPEEQESDKRIASEWARLVLEDFMKFLDETNIVEVDLVQSDVEHYLEVRFGPKKADSTRQNGEDGEK